MFINKLDALSIPIINYSRPVLLFLIEIDSGSKEPYYLSFKKELDDIDKIFIDSLRENASNRGLFLELPVFDLQDAKKLASSSILSDPTNEISSKYDFDKLIKIKLTKSGVNDWFFSGDIESNLSYPQNTIQKISDIFDEFLLKIIDETLEELDINSQKISGVYQYMIEGLIKEYGIPYNGNNVPIDNLYRYKEIKWFLQGFNEELIISKQYQNITITLQEAY